MTTAKKFDLRITRGDAGWDAEIIRRATSRKFIVSKSRTGFSTEAEAQAWGEETLKGFLHNLAARHKRRAD
ncbi:MAG: DUF3622 domain-containing protein [Gammaproteobacteria bacterium]